MSHLAPIAHAEPVWYGDTAVWGRFAARGAASPALERAIDYQFSTLPWAFAALECASKPAAQVRWQG